MDKIIVFLLGVLAYGFVSVLHAAPLPPAPASLEITPSASESTGSPKPFYQLYTYYGDRYRDPFIPLTGEFRSSQDTDHPPQISSLVLKGIIQDAKSRMALLTSGVSSYILRNGRLYDGRNHMMKGISGIIKPNSVVLTGSDRTVKELKANITL